MRPYLRSGPCRCDRVTKMSHWVRGSPHRMTGALTQQREVWTHDTQGDLCVRTEAETGLMRLQAEEPQGWPASPRDRGRGVRSGPLAASRRREPAGSLHLDLWPVGPCENKRLCPPPRWPCYDSPREQYHSRLGDHDSHTLGVMARREPRGRQFGETYPNARCP